MAVVFKNSFLSYNDNPWPATESQFRSRDEPLGWDEIVQTVREQVRQEMRRMQQNNCT